MTGGSGGSPGGRFEDWLIRRAGGLYCVPGDFFIDPSRPVPRAVITHGHADHARPGHGLVAATAATLAIMGQRFGPGEGPGAPGRQALAYGETVGIGDAQLTLYPAGHVLGSAQAAIAWAGRRAVLSGDYKREADPTCIAFEPVACDLFVTEATFALPVFRHPPAGGEIARLLLSLARNPDRCHLVGVYALGKAQRLIALLRRAGYDAPIHLHGALIGLCQLYTDLGVELGDLRPVADVAKAGLAGQLVLAPPSALADRWSRRLPDPLTALASGWMQVRQRARQRGVELPLVISDHADWDGLNRTLDEVAAPEVWVTHGREEALMHAASQRGMRVRAPALLGREEGD